MVRQQRLEEVAHRMIAEISRDIPDLEWTGVRGQPLPYGRGSDRAAGTDRSRDRKGTVGPVHAPEDDVLAVEFLGRAAQIVVQREQKVGASELIAGAQNQALAVAVDRPVGAAQGHIRVAERVVDRGIPGFDAERFEIMFSGLSGPSQPRLRSRKTGMGARGAWVRAHRFLETLERLVELAGEAQFTAAIDQRSLDH